MNKIQVHALLLCCGVLSFFFSGGGFKSILERPSTVKSIIEGVLLGWGDSSISMGGNRYLILDESGEKTSIVSFLIIYEIHFICSVFYSFRKLRFPIYFRLLKPRVIFALMDWKICIDYIWIVCVFFLNQQDLHNTLCWKPEVIHGEQEHILETMISQGVIEVLSVIFTEEHDPHILVWSVTYFFNVIWYILIGCC